MDEYLGILMITQVVNASAFINDSTKRSESL